MKLKLNNVRLAFPSLFEAKTVNGEGDPRFSAVFLMSPKHPQLEEIRKAMKQVAKEKWGEKWEPIYNQLEKNSAASVKQKLFALPRKCSIYKQRPAILKI